MTRGDAASDFFGEEYVPRRAYMGVGTIAGAGQIYLLAFGEGKAQVVAQSVEGPITPNIPATYLQEHPNTQFVLDEAAAEQLTQLRCPWVLARR